MENGKSEKFGVAEKPRFDIESKDLVRESLVPVIDEILTIIDSSLLDKNTQQKMREFVEKIATGFEDDGWVERGWVTFDDGGNILRARSQEGIYDLQNTLRYVLEQISDNFFRGFLGRNHDGEIGEVRVAVEDVINSKIGI